MQAWLESHWETILATIATAFVIPFLIKLWDGLNGRWREERLAATLLLPHVIKYKLYWVKKYSDDANAQPDLDEEFQWSGDKFDPILSNEKVEATAAKLAKPLMVKMFAVEMLAHRWKSDIAIASEYDTEDIDIVGPLATAEIALAADDLLRGLAKAAKVPTPDAGDDMAYIQSEAEGLREKRAKWKQRQEESQRRFREQILEQTEAKP